MARAVASIIGLVELTRAGQLMVNVNVPADTGLPAGGVAVLCHLLADLGAGRPLGEAEGV